LTTLGKRLNSTVEAYNAFNSSLDSQLVTQARRFSALQGLDQSLTAAPPLEVLAVPAQREDVHAADDLEVLVDRAAQDAARAGVETGTDADERRSTGS